MSTRHEVIDSVLLLAGNLCVNVLLLQFKHLYNIYHQSSIETNVSISNELHFPNVYQSVNYIGSLAKFT